MSQARSAQRGMSLVELAAAFSALAIALVAVAELIVESSRVFGNATAQGELLFTFDDSLDQVARELTDSGSETDGTERVLSHPVGQDTAATSTITFRKRIDVTGDPARDWSGEITYALVASWGEVASNGVDDDGDGLVDERCLQRSVLATSTMTTSIIADGVTALEFRRAASTYAIDVRLRVARYEPRTRTLLERDIATSVPLRNIPSQP